MKDTFAETVVQVKPSKIMQMGRIVLIAATAVLALMGLLVSVLLLGACICGVLLFLIHKKTRTEYEYIHTNDELDIDRVCFGSSRKHLLTVKLDHVELVAKADSPEIDHYGAWDVKDFSSGDEGDNTYYMVCRVDGKKMKLKMDLDEKMVRSLTLRIRDKIR